MLVLLLAFAGASGDLVSAAGASGGPIGPVLTATVVPASQVMRQTPRSVSELQPLFAKLRLGASGDPIAMEPGKRTDVTSLLDRLQNQQARVTPSEAQTAEQHHEIQGSRLPSPNPQLSSALALEETGAASDGQVTGSPSTGKLWGAIEPCWRNLGVRGRVPVVLEVSLDSTGGLRVPPTVIRSPTALLNESRLQSEANALAAIAACAPRGEFQFGGKTYRLEFPAAP